MKKIFIAPLLIAVIAVHAQTKAPPLVIAAFEKKFADATHVKWGKENAKEYEAGFELKGTKMYANYDLQGNWKETETEIAVTDLPEAVAKSISAKYPGAVISGAGKIEKADGKIIYEADIKMKGKKIEVELSGDGKFVK
jgi:putative PepSY-like beta-lactamase-inhibitor